MNNDLTIIIVSYNVQDLLRRCLQSIAASSACAHLRCQTIVVDNASKDGSAAIVANEFPHVRLLTLGQNIGFAGGNNAGLRVALVHHPRYIMLLNPDTEVVDDALEQLVSYLDAHADVAVVGPQLRYGDGALQSSRRRWPTVGTLFWESTLLEQWWPRNPWARRYRFDDAQASVPQDVDWLVGAALVVRTSAIRDAGLLDDSFFMYSEELEWQTRLAAHGRIVYLPNALIVHHEGKSSEQNLAQRHINFNRSKLRYAQQRWSKHVAWPLRIFLLISYIIQLLIEAAKWLLGHKRELRCQRIHQYRAILRSGL